MAVDSFSQIVGRVQLRVPQASRFLVEDFVRNAYREIFEFRLWSWRRKFGQFIFPEVVDDGTVTVTLNSTIVTGSGTAFDSSMVGRQFRINVSTPIYTIVSVQSTTQLTLDNVWGSATTAATGYEIYLAYVTVPSDFWSFVVIWDPRYNWRLLQDYTQAQLDAVDAQRSNSGNVYLFAYLDTTQNQTGVVSQPVQVEGSGNDPGSSGTYTGPTNALFTVEITTGGAPGTAVYQWKKNDGSYTTGVTTESDGSAQELQDGVHVYFPTGVSYTLGDIWAINATAGSNPGSARFEAWPHVKTQYVIPYYYIAQPPDISESGATLPRTITGDMLLEKALSEAAKWPGPSTDKPNPYYRLELADRHEKQFMAKLLIAERNDEELSMQDVTYQSAEGLTFAPFPALGDSNWLQSHDW